MKIRKINLDGCSFKINLTHFYNLNNFPNSFINYPILQWDCSSLIYKNYN